VLRPSLRLRLRRREYGLPPMLFTGVFKRSLVIDGFENKVSVCWAQSLALPCGWHGRHPSRYSRRLGSRSAKSGRKNTGNERRAVGESSDELNYARTIYIGWPDFRASGVPFKISIRKWPVGYRRLNTRGRRSFDGRTAFNWRPLVIRRPATSKNRFAQTASDSAPADRIRHRISGRN